MSTFGPRNLLSAWYVLYATDVNLLSVDSLRKWPWRLMDIDRCGSIYKPPISASFLLHSKPHFCSKMADADCLWDESRRKHHELLCGNVLLPNLNGKSRRTSHEYSEHLVNKVKAQQRMRGYITTVAGLILIWMIWRWNFTLAGGQLWLARKNV